MSLLHRFPSIVLLLLGGGIVPTSAADEHKEEPIKIGMSQSFFPTKGEGQLGAVTGLFGTLMRSPNHAASSKIAVADPVRLGQLLAEGDIMLGVFNGVEFGWAKQKYPALAPFVLAVNEDRRLQALMVVRNDSAIQGFHELKGKRLAVSRNMRHHCTIFLNRCCDDAERTPSEFFAEIETLPNAEKALDRVYEGKVDCLLVDKLAFDHYQRRKPVRFAELKVTAQSAIFPAAVIAFNPSTMSKASDAELRKRFLKANKTLQGQHLMSLFRFTAFEPVPEGYERAFLDIAEVYPATSSATPVAESGTPRATPVGIGN